MINFEIFIFVLEILQDLKDSKIFSQISVIQSILQNRFSAYL